VPRELDALPIGEVGVELALELVRLFAQSGNLALRADGGELLDPGQDLGQRLLEVEPLLG